MSFVKYFEIHQGSDEFASDMQHINDIEYSCRHVKYCLLQVVHSVQKHTIHLHLKEGAVLDKQSC